MALISFITPLDQPLDTRRLLEGLRRGLADARFEQLTIVVAYAKSGPLLRLQSELESWKAAGKRIRGIFGIDQQGTSREALGLALGLFNELYVTQEPRITFHPKIYLFDGPAHARAIIGSNNLTVGGTETNFEAATVLDLNLPQDQTTHDQLQAMWSGLLPAVCPATRLVDAAALQALVASGTAPGEREMQARTGIQGNRPTAPRTGLGVKPASPLPANLMRKNAAAAATAGAAVPVPTPAAGPAAVAPLRLSASGFAIQIKPHHNGEIFLSKTAALQDPGFFSWPFTGLTIPKKAGNPAYPQRVPDPVVNIDVYGPGAQPILSLRSYNLNTVYYSTKSEIRITASQLVGVVLDYSVMIMIPGASAGVDYEIVIHRPDSPDFPLWLASCNQTMPSGGQQARQFGWF